MKNQLKDAVQKKNPQEIRTALENLEKKVPLEEIPVRDRQIQENAKELLLKLEPPPRTFFLNAHTTFYASELFHDILDKFIKLLL